MGKIIEILDTKVSNYYGNVSFFKEEEEDGSFFYYMSLEDWNTPSTIGISKDFYEAAVKQFKDLEKL